MQQQTKKKLLMQVDLFTAAVVHIAPLKPYFPRCGLYFEG